MKKEGHQLAVFRLAMGSTMLSALMLFALIAGEAYVRWFLNQNFSFLGGNALPALALLVAVQIAALLYSQKS